MVLIEYPLNNLQLITILKYAGTDTGVLPRLYNYYNFEKQYMYKNMSNGYFT